MSDQDQLVSMEIKGLILDPSSNVPIIILKRSNQAQFLPIWIGSFEANAIALELEEVKPPRPMTHDLLASTIHALGAKILRVVINGLEESTFFAEIVLDLGTERVTLDSRPSDAIALALRAKAEILVAESVLERAQTEELTERLSSEDRLKKWLEDVDPEDLGKYTM